MVTVQQSLQHVVPNSLRGRSPLHPSLTPGTPARTRQPLRVQAAVQPDMMVAAGTLAFTAVNSAFWTGALGGAYGAVSALTRPGEKKDVLKEAALNASGSMHVGGLMGLANGTLLNLGLDHGTASMGGVALGLGMYALLVAAMNTPKE